MASLTPLSIVSHLNCSDKDLKDDVVWVGVPLSRGPASQDLKHLHEVLQLILIRQLQRVRISKLDYIWFWQIQLVCNAALFIILSSSFLPARENRVLFGAKYQRWWERVVRASSASNLFTWLNDLLIQHFCEILFKFISVLQRFLVLHILILVLVLIVLQKLGNFILRMRRQSCTPVCLMTLATLQVISPGVTVQFFLPA